ncbi:MAG: hypothetical protein KAQ83_01915 [Nanoarchaeota archaeon]|nr:hypothetical protein [Nanoarchaeota archaeon]
MIIKGRYSPKSAWNKKGDISTSWKNQDRKTNSKLYDFIVSKIAIDPLIYYLICPRIAKAMLNLIFNEKLD